MASKLANLALTAALGLAITITLNACGKESKTPAKIIGGTYSFGSDGNGSGTLMVYPLDEHSALFSLSLSRGAPSYNSGELSDKMAIKDNAVIYEYEDCKLKFEFSQDSVKITTDEKRNECGFGAEVVADNTYKLINKAIPEYYINMQDDTIRFNNANATATAVKPETTQPTPAGTGLCVADENILISFKMEKSSKILSVCVAKDESYIVYRFGAQGNIEFEFPENKTGSWDKFTVSLMQSRLDDMYKLEFANHGYKYEVYHNYERQRGDGNYDFHSVGVVITKVSTGKQTNLEGMSNTIIGSLDESQKYKKLKITTEEIKPDDD